MFNHRKHVDQQSLSEKRSGVVLVEFALVCSLFAMFLAMIMELGHVYLVINTLNAAAKRSARYGSVEGITSAQVQAKAKSFIDSSLNPAQATISILNGSIFDSNGFDPQNFKPDSLPAIELVDAESRQIFVVRITVPYDDVALIPPFWIKGITLVGQSVMRHE